MGRIKKLRIQKLLIKSAALMVGLLSIHLATAVNFHYQIDVETSLLADQEGKLSALQMRWDYAADISKLLLPDLGDNESEKQQNLAEVAQNIIVDLKDLNYFTKLLINDRRVEFGLATDASAQWLESDQIRLQFTLPLKKSTTVSKKRLVLAMADINDSAFLLFDSKDSVSIDQTLPVCKIKLVVYGEEVSRAADIAKEKYQHGQAEQHIEISCKKA